MGREWLRGGILALFPLSLPCPTVLAQYPPSFCRNSLTSFVCHFHTSSLLLFAAPTLQIEEFKEAFAVIDTNNDGFIDKTDLFVRTYNDLYIPKRGMHTHTHTCVCVCVRECFPSVVLQAEAVALAHSHLQTESMYTKNLVPVPACLLGRLLSNIASFLITSCIDFKTSSQSLDTLPLFLSRRCFECLKDILSGSSQSPPTDAEITGMLGSE